MTLVTDGHDFHYETANVCRLFVPHEKIVTVRERPDDAAGLLAYTRLTETADGAEAFCELSLDEYPGAIIENVHLGDSLMALCYEISNAKSES